MIEEKIHRSPRRFDQCAYCAGVSPRTRCGQTGPRICRHCGKVGYGAYKVTHGAENDGVMFSVFETQDFRTLLIGRKGDTVP